MSLENPKLNALKLLFTQFNEKTYSLTEFFKELLIVSQVNLLSKPNGLIPTQDDSVFVKVSHADGTKCPRCWNWDITLNPDGLCKRCQEVLGIE